jgi:hypothetical protein
LRLLSRYVVHIFGLGQGFNRKIGNAINLGGKDCSGFIFVDSARFVAREQRRHSDRAGARLAITAG